MNVNEKLIERGRIIAQQRTMNDKVIAEGRDFTPEEKTQYETMEKDGNLIKAQVDRHLAIEAAAKDNEHVDPSIRAAVEETEDGPKRPNGTKEYRAAFTAFARHGRNHLDQPIRAVLNTGTTTDGGYLVPTVYNTELIKKLFNVNIMRPLSTVIATESTENIAVEAGIATAVWLAENATYTESEPTFGQISIGSNKLGVISKVSEELLQDAFFDIQSYLIEQFGTSFGLAEEAAFIAGNGTGKPRGVTLDATAGVTFAGVAAITGDEIMGLFHALPRMYRNKAQWILSDAAVLATRRLKDTYGQYLWQPGLQAGVPDLLLGRGVNTSDFMAVPAAGAVSALFGDYSYYTIADRRTRFVQRLDELYAANGQVGFRAYERVDGKLTRTDAVVKGTQAAS
jgi:HK97 family phage major capsid protein